ncbi:MAG TPA: trypsin-like peptidase domain-containing protein [Gemmatimonadales bacterium]|nr:trypsin-like peptidase domain-containing protein [Gemmatimonadales bacterium]
MTAQFTFLSGARVGQVETFRKAYIGLGRHPLSDVRFDAERDLDVSSRHAAIVRQGDTFVVRDLGSKNGTFVNGRRLTGDAALQDGDVIGFGAHGPAVEFRLLMGEPAGEAPSAALRASAERISSPRAQYPAVTPPAAPAVAAARRSSTAVRIAAEVARQTRGLRRSSKVLIGVLVIALGALGWNQWQRARDTHELSRLQARADSLNHEAQRLLTRFQSELESVREALRQSQAEVARLRSELAAAGAHGDVARLRTELDAAETRQRGLAGAAAIDYRAISKNNQDAIALLVVRFSDVETFSGTAFAVDSGGTLVTNKHLLVGDQGDRRPQAIAVKFSGSKQWFPGRLVGVADTSDVGVLRVDLRGGTPRVLGFARDPAGLQRGDPVAIIGYPLGEDLPMQRAGQTAVADPTLTVGTVSKVLANLVQLDGYGAPGSSGSPIFDREGRVVAVLYGGNRQSQGRIVYGVPAVYVVRYLRQLGASFPLRP